MFTFINSPPLTVIFDPTSVEERFPSVAFEITANWMMPFQEVRIVIKDCWFVYSKLNQFEVDLKRLLKEEKDNAKLENMDCLPIIELKRNNEKLTFELIAADTVDMGTVSIKTNLYEQELIEIIENIKNWSKWW